MLRTRFPSRIAAAQALTVLASATGPLLLAECVTRTGSYAAMFYAFVLVGEFGGEQFIYFQF